MKFLQRPHKEVLCGEARQRYVRTTFPNCGRQCRTVLQYQQDRAGWQFRSGIRKQLVGTGFQSPALRLVAVLSLSAIHGWYCLSPLLCCSLPAAQAPAEERDESQQSLTPPTITAADFPAEFSTNPLQHNHFATSSTSTTQSAMAASPGCCTAIRTDQSAAAARVQETAA